MKRFLLSAALLAAATTTIQAHTQTHKHLPLSYPLSNSHILRPPSAHIFSVTFT